MTISGIRKILSEWADVVREEQLIERGFVFGSLVNKDGAQFYPGSDIDILVRTPASVDGDCLGRANVLRRLRPHLVELEKKIFFELKLESPVRPTISCLAVTSIECNRGIHKDNLPKLLTEARFSELNAQDCERLVPVCRDYDPLFFPLNVDLVPAIALAQKTRNGYLQTDLHGKVFLSTDPGTDPVQKTLMRAAAQVAYFCKKTEGQGDPLAREDTAEGLEFLTVLLNQSDKASTTEIRAVRDLLAVRRGARGRGDAISPEQLLLLTELLFDKAVSQIQPTPLDNIENFSNILK